MAKQRHQLKPIYPSRPLYLDDRLGPALVALWLLVAVGIASIRWFANDAWQQGQLLPLAGVATLIVVAVVVSVMIATTSPHRFRRGIFLAFFLSALVNLAVALGLRTVHIEPPPIPLSVVKPPEPIDEPMTLEEFYPMAVDGDDRPQQEIRKPVATGEPDRENRDLIRKTTVRNEEFTRVEIEAATATPVDRRPMTVSRRQAIESVPRQAERQGTLSRQTVKKDSMLGRPQQVDAPSSLSMTEPLVANPQDFDPRKQSPAPSPSEPVQAEAESALQPSPSRLARATAAADYEQQTRQLPVRPRSTNPSEPSERSPAELPETELAPERQLDAVAVTSGKRQPSASPPADDPRRVEVPPEMVKLDQPGATRSEAVMSVPRTVNQPLDLPQRRPMTARTARPTAIDLDVEEVMSPSTPTPIPTVTPSIEQQASAAVEHPLLLPSPDERPNRPRPIVPDTGSRQASDAARGMADAASDPAVNIASIDSGTNASQMSSPERRLLTAERVRRRAMQRPQTPQVEPTRSSTSVERPTPTPADVSDTTQPRRGQVVTVQAPTFPGDDHLAAGVPQAISEAEINRAQTSQVPNTTSDSVAISNATDRRLSTVAPGLPTNVRSPQIESASATAQPSAAAASAGVTRKSSQAMAASPRVDIQRPLTGLPLGDTQAAPRLARAAVVQEPQPTSRPSSGSPPRRAVQGGANPIPSKVTVPLVQTEGTQDGEAQPNAVASSSQRTSTTASESAARVSDSLDSSAAPSIELQASAAALTRSDTPSRAPTETSVAPTVAPRGRKRSVVPRSASSSVSVPSPSTSATPINEINTFALEVDRLATSGGRSGGLEVNMDVAEGLGGLASDVSTDIGSISRRTSPESLHVEDTVGRFIRRQVGGELSIRSDDVRPAKAYQTRLNRQGEQPFGGNGRPSPRTEESIELGLVYLASVQRDDGSWNLNDAGESELAEEDRTEAVIESNTAATGLCLLAYLGAGYHHRSDKYGEEIQEALQYLVQHQKSDGDLYLPMDDESNKSAWLYSHAIASIALCEAYGMTQDSDLREPAQLAVDFIVEAQNKRRGGWRYQPGVGSDTSVSGWMVMAMRSAELANLQVPIEVWDQVEDWLDGAQASPENPQFYRYNPFAPNRPTQVHGRRASRTMTAVGLLMRMYTGWYRDDGPMVAGADYLADNLPSMGTWEAPKRDTYYWYYATQVMFHMGGEHWQKWNEELHPLLTSTQIQVGDLAGSWDPQRPMPDRWATQAGRIYVTTLNLLSLEVFYRHLPIYEDTVR